MYILICFKILIAEVNNIKCRISNEFVLKIKCRTSNDFLFKNKIAAILHLCSNCSSMEFY